MSTKAYLGDAVYAEFDAEFMTLTLTTSDGIEDTNTIVLETSVLLHLTDMMAEQRRAWMAGRKRRRK